MVQFLKFLLASIIGALIAFGILILFGVISIAAISAKFSKPTFDIEEGVLYMKVNEQIPELSENLPQGNGLSFSTKPHPGLQDYIHYIEEAKSNKNIHGIYLDLGLVNEGTASISQLKRAIEDFKTSDKFVIAYADYYTQKAYDLALVADSIYLNPFGKILLYGYGVESTFYKKMLDKFGIKAQVFHVGEYKGATEPFRFEGYSKENKEQIRAILDSRLKDFINDIHNARGISKEAIYTAINDLTLQDVELAKQQGFVDNLYYEDQVLAAIKKLSGKKKEDKIRLYSMTHLYTNDSDKQLNQLIGKKVKHIAVVVAEGGIVDGQGGQGEIGGDKYAKLIRNIRYDENVKGIVLRVNSGGGSALASEIMWRELKMAAEENHLPIAVSMSDVAASGGYYIATAADSIFAEPNTITGSIGVFGIIPSAEEFLENTIGVTFDTIKTTQYSAAISPFRDISTGEAAIIQKQIAGVYDNFLQRVAEGRDMTKEEVNTIARGRVWTGVKAKEIGLIDEFGDLPRAIESVQSMYSGNNSNTASLDIKYYPTVQSPVQRIVSQFTEGDVSIEPNLHLLPQGSLKELENVLSEIQELDKMTGIQMRMLETFE